MALNPIYFESFIVCLGVALILLESIQKEKNRMFIAWIGTGGLVAVSLFLFIYGRQFTSVSPFYSADRLASFYKLLIVVATILVLLMSLSYSRVTTADRKIRTGAGEFFILPIFACAGMMWLVSASDLIFLFVTLELVTIVFYVLVAYTRYDALCLEAAVKYFVLGAFSTGFLVYGISWIFGVTGQTNFEKISGVLRTLPPSASPALLFGLGLVLIAVGFKIAAFPFQFWVPDVYQGAPTPVTAYLSVASKAAGFVILLRMVEVFSPILQAKILGILSVLAGLTVFFGNLAALLQTNLKRLLAYSSIAHAGFLLIGVSSVSVPFAPKAVSFYMGAYLFMTLLAFFAVVMVSRETGGEEMTNFRGLGKRSPLLAISMVLAMLSLAGIPLTAGFFGKFFIFMVAIQAHQWALVGLGTLGVCCGFYYYLKIIGVMYWQTCPVGAAGIKISADTAFILVVLCISIILLGIFPQLLLALL
ncbi:MAG: hypothetical protein C5B47_05385 [Verrucomicrobia bacterium]|nr:MAG: hypothetical protein C5B47_05385 [Verrucomicrobiota bacterium]